MSEPRPIDSDEEYQRRKELMKEHEEEEREDLKNSLIGSALRLVGVPKLISIAITRDHDE